MEQLLGQQKEIDRGGREKGMGGNYDQSTRYLKSTIIYNEYTPPPKKGNYLSQSVYHVSARDSDT